MSKIPETGLLRAGGAVGFPLLRFHLQVLNLIRRSEIKPIAPPDRGILFLTNKDPGNSTDKSFRPGGCGGGRPLVFFKVRAATIALLLHVDALLQEYHRDVEVEILQNFKQGRAATPVLRLHVGAPSKGAITAPMWPLSENWTSSSNWVARVMFFLISCQRASDLIL